MNGGREGERVGRMEVVKQKILGVGVGRRAKIKGVFAAIHQFSSKGSGSEEGCVTDQ